MRNFGFVKAGAAIPAVRVADVNYNTARIKRLIGKAVEENVEIVCFPEMCITGYTCQDLFRYASLLDESDAALKDLAAYCRDLPVVAIVGAPVRQGNRLYNSAVVMAAGECRVVNKTYLPNYNEFYEKRWFAEEDMEKAPAIFELPSGVKFAVEICEDLWAPLPPSGYAATAGADIIFNLSATNELVGKHRYLTSLIAQQSARCLSGYVYSSAGFGESSQDVVYGGNAFVYENGQRLAHSERFSFSEQLVTAQIDVERLRAERLANTTFCKTQGLWQERSVCVPLKARLPETAFRLERRYNPYPFIPEEGEKESSCNEIFNIQVAGLAKRLLHLNCKDAVIGVSGGLDSTLALLVCAAAFDKTGIDRHGIHGVTMPGFGTSERTHANAVALMDSLGITRHEIPISTAVEQHFRDLRHDGSVHDATYENSQARYRTMLLMDMANKVNGIAVGTGDLSELALGWCTYNGDHMSMYSVNAGVPKTLARHLVEHVAEISSNPATKKILYDITDTPISPELLPGDGKGKIMQKTEDILGPYALHDFFLYYFMRFGFSREKIQLLAERAFDGSGGPAYSKETIAVCLNTFLKRFFSQQFKRSCLPDGPKVGSVGMSPRGDWRMPSDASPELWLK